MLFTMFGMVIEVNPLHPENALLAIDVPPVTTTVLSEPGTVFELFEYDHAPNIYPKKLLLVELPPTNGIVNVASALQPLKAELPMLVTLSGIVIEINPLQPENA